MATRRKNEWLEDDEASDGADVGYDSEVAESRAKTIGSKGVKRRKIGHTSESESDSEQSADEREVASKDTAGSKTAVAATEVEDVPAEDYARTDESRLRQGDVAATTSKPKSSIAKKLAKSVAKTKNTGVIYISRIPPFMKPHTLKHLLEPYAPSGIGRLFLTPETALAHSSRVKGGGNKKRNFSDGWVEFLSKKEAKIAVETLNTSIIGGKKGGYYHDDVWNLKYLKGFKWRNLTEQIANENAERSARLRAEGAKERREVREYLGNVERAKMLDGMEKKRKTKGEVGGDVHGAGDEKPEAVGEARNGHHRPERRQFRQVEVLSKSNKGAASSDQTDEVKRVLSKIF